MQPAHNSSSSSTFANRAEYFDRRAAKARFDAERERMLEVAGFYRKLSHITPTFPPGYKMPGSLDRKSRYEARAEECRTMAEHFHDPLCRAELHAVADSYERLSASAARLQAAE